VSINTFIELIGERYDDPDFRRHFSSVVRRDVRRLVEVFEKLAGLVTEGELNFTTVDVHTVVDDVVTAIELVDEVPARALQLDVTRETTPLVVKIDPAQLRKAPVSSGIWRTAASDQRACRCRSRHAEREGGEGVRSWSAHRSGAGREAAPRLDPVQMVRSLIDGEAVEPAATWKRSAGGWRCVKGRHELHFLVTPPPRLHQHDRQRAQAGPRRRRRKLGPAKRAADAAEAELRHPDGGERPHGPRSGFVGSSRTS
jgi:hypothetical protein